MWNSSVFARLRLNASDHWRAAIRCARKMRAPPCGSVSGGSMAANALIDTGAILALLDRTDRWHQPCVDAFQQFRLPLITLPLITSDAVLTELLHLVGDDRRETEAAWKFILSGAVALMTIGDPELRDVHTLMSRYGDPPMDFSDAILVHLAKRESLTTIFTVDHSDFEAYRIDGQRRFRVLPARSA
jgi:predicted nucleic acid-binding protein